MADFLQEQLGVATGGVKWDSGNFKLWQSTNPNIILFCPKQAVLSKGTDKRYQSMVTVDNQQVGSTGGTGGEDKITGGAAVIAFTTAIDFTKEELERLQEQWRAEYLSKGGTTQNPRFVAMSLQKGVARPAIPEDYGSIDVRHNQKDIGTAGGTVSYLMDLTELGAQVFAQGIKERKGVPGAVQMEFQYLQYVPPVGARVTLQGKRAFKHLSAAMDVSVNGFWYGGSAKIDAAWESMTREGIVKIEYNGTVEDPELAKLRDEMVRNFSQQAQKQWFDMLFQPKPEVAPAEPGKTRGVFGGANFALKWRKEEEAIDLALDIEFKGWTYMPFRLDMPFTELAKLDESYVLEVQTQKQIQANVIVDPDPMLQTAAISWTASEGKSAEAPIFGMDGGSKTYIITSKNPNAVKVSYQAKISYAEPKWPIVTTKGSTTVAEGGNQVLLKTAAWVGRHMIYMFVRDGDRIVPLSELSEDDYLIANVSYKGPHLRLPVKGSARITPLEPLEFSYPLSPEGATGEARFSAVGVLGGKMVRAKEQIINMNEEAVFILASKDSVQLVSENTVLPESDALAQSLLASKAQAIVTPVSGMGGATAETDRAATTNGNGSKELSGKLFAVEYGASGAALWIESNGDRKRIKLHTVEEADPFDDDSPKQVRVKLDESGEYADSILVELH
jgi:hypothetical protein